MDNLTTKDGDDSFSNVRVSTQNIKCEIKTETEEYAEIDFEYGSNIHLELETPVQSEAKWETPFLTKWMLDYGLKLESRDTAVENEENNILDTYRTIIPEEENCMKMVNNIGGKKFTQKINSTDFESKDYKKNSCIEDGITFNTINELLTSNLDVSEEKQTNYTNIHEPMSGNHNPTKQKHTPREDKHLMSYISGKSFEQIFHGTKVRHSNERPYKCELCSKSFGQKSHLTDHTRIHTNEKPYKCDFCSKSFAQKSTLNVHIQVHTNDKSFACNFCSKSFGQKRYLTEHIRTHTHKKPYKCEFCSKSFGQKCHLTEHIRIHTNEKPYKCNFCSKSFVQKSSLAVHIRIHTNEKPFTCNICAKSFAQRSNLTDHKRTHTNEKPYKCDFCSKPFGQKSNLSEHIRTHTNEKPLKCSFCSKSFAHRSALTVHSRSHTNV